MIYYDETQQAYLDAILYRPRSVFAPAAPPPAPPVAARRLWQQLTPDPLTNLKTPTKV